MKQLSLSNLAQRVSNYYEVDLLEKTRRERSVQARKVFYVMCHICGHRNEDIGIYLGYDRCTVRHHVKLVEKEMEEGYTYILDIAKGLLRNEVFLDQVETENDLLRSLLLEINQENVKDICEMIKVRLKMYKKSEDKTRHFETYSTGISGFTW